VVDERKLDDETLELVSRARSGRGEAFEALFDRHRSYLLRVVQLRLDGRVRSRVDPSDVVQETYMEAHRRFEDYLQRPVLPLRLWLRQIACDFTVKAARRHVATARRAVQREMPLPEESSLQLARCLVAAGSTPSQHLQRQEMVRRVREAIERLPDHEREVIVMRHYEGLSNQDIGAVLNIQPATVSKRHGRAMLRLHEMLFVDEKEDEK
jgi:RNA polymerase sigma-70 factor (ECF subfamily)